MLQRHWMAILDHNISSIFCPPPLLEFLPFFVCLHSDILKKFNPNIKGMSKGQGNKHTGFNLAVSGAKISWVNVVLSLDIFLVFFLCLKFCSDLQIFQFTQRNPRTGRETDWKHEIWCCECILYYNILIHALIFFVCFNVPKKCHTVLHLGLPDPFRRWILIMTGSWWPFSSEEMTCVSTATTEWVAARRRRGEFAIIRQIKDVFHKRQPPNNGTVAKKYRIPSCCATPGVQSRLMISLLKWDRSLERNNKALWPALPP